MRKRIVTPIIFSILLIGNLYAGFFYNTYFVIFDNKPDIIDKNVYLKGVKIGIINDIKLSANTQSILLQIYIEKKYSKFITENTVFYIKDGKLVYGLLKESGKFLPEDSKILGFSSELKFNIYKFTLKGKNISNELLKKMKEILHNFKDDVSSDSNNE